MGLILKNNKTTLITKEPGNYRALLFNNRSSN